MCLGLGPLGRGRGKSEELLVFATENDMLWAQNEPGGLIRTVDALLVLRLSLDAVGVLRNPTLIVPVRAPCLNTKRTARRRNDALVRLFHERDPSDRAAGAQAAVKSAVVLV